MEVAVSGLWPRGLRHGAKDVGHTDVRRFLALFGAHSLHALERSRAVWAARRALLFPFEERADGPL